MTHVKIKRSFDCELIESLQRSLIEAPLYEFDGSDWWVAYDGDRPVGFAGSKVSDVWLDTVYLCRAAVEVDYRGQGLQKRLIRTRLKFARKHGIRWAFTDTRLNPASANSLISCGFKMYEPVNPWGFQNTCYWRRKL